MEKSAIKNSLDLDLDYNYDQKRDDEENKLNNIEEIKELKFNNK